MRHLRFQPVRLSAALAVLVGGVLGTAGAANAAPPSNDAFGNRTDLGEASVFNESALTAGATAQAGEPAHAGEPATASIWYQWTAPGDVVVQSYSALTQLGPSIDEFPHALAFYTGGRLTALTPVASDFGRAPTLEFRAKEGTTYDIALNVSRSLARLGNTHLFIDTRPVNDDLADATKVSGPSGSASGYVGTATLELGDEPQHSLQPLDEFFGSVWFDWTAPTNGFTRFGVECCAGEGTQPVMAVYTGSAMADLTPVSSSYGCSVGAFNTCTSFQHVKGTTYHIAVQGNGPLAFPFKWAPVASGCTVSGTAGADVLTGTSRADLICGLGGDDTITGLGGDDVVVGGPGTDTVDYSNAPTGVTADLRRAASFGEGTDSLQQIENITGSRFADDLDGDGSPNVLRGGAGPDRVSGQEGDDR
jgi:Ca2+-binding RTX toxin-like protein